MKTTKTVTVAIASILLAGWAPASAATPPNRIHYQGVLRGASDAPLDGAFDMVFRLWDAASAGNEILLDRHLAVNSQAVTVTGGLFNADIGSGEVLDGAGPGAYTDVSAVFRDYGDVWLEIQVGAEVLAPRIPVTSAPFALNAHHLDGKRSSQFIDTSSGSQSKLGELVLGQASGLAGTYGVEGYGTTGGGYFRDEDNSATCTAADGDIGVSGYGNTAGGYFRDPDSSGFAYVGNGHHGISAFGSAAGGYFSDAESTAYAYVGNGDFGVSGYGIGVGAFFRDLDESGYAWLGYGDYGVAGHGNATGGYFSDLDSTGYAFLGSGDQGVEGYGNLAGGYFRDLNASGYAYVGFDHFGIDASGGLAGGQFRDQDHSGYAAVAADDWGIQASGNGGGGYFDDSNSTGSAWVGYGDRGIWAKGTFAGGTFSHPDNVTHWADVSTPVHKIFGTGAVSFVQNHPYEKDKVVVYAAPEGDEVAVYTRGSARLVDGAATVRLGQTFAWVANPDIGLTAHLTPRSDADLYVERVSTNELVVRSRAGSDPDAAFDYIVYGLRIGFEEVAPVRVKEREAFLPAQSAVAESYTEYPELRRYSAMERFKEMRTALGETAALNLSNSQAMAAAIDADRDEIVAAALAEADAEHANLARRPEDRGDVAVAPGHPAVRAIDPAAPAPPSMARGTTPVPVAMGSLSTAPVREVVRPGDVLAIDPAEPGSLRRADTPLDPGVAGCVAEPPQGTEVAAGQALVATSGLVLCLADASFGPIAPGDLLTTSSNPGHAARADEAAQGAILGKAMEALPGGSGLIRVLIR